MYLYRSQVCLTQLRTNTSRLVPLPDRTQIVANDDKLMSPMSRVRTEFVRRSTENMIVTLDTQHSCCLCVCFHLVFWACVLSTVGILYASLEIFGW